MIISIHIKIQRSIEIDLEKYLYAQFIKVVCSLVVLYVVCRHNFMYVIYMIIYTYLYTYSL